MSRWPAQQLGSVRLPRLAECIRNPAMRLKGPWKSVGDVEIAVAEYVDWFNHRRLYGQIGLVPPAEYEATHRAGSRPAPPQRTTLRHPSQPGQVPGNRASTKPGAISQGNFCGDATERNSD